MSEQQSQSGQGRQVATLAGGCFWCLEAVFERLKGVEQVVSGYTGGTRPSPTYQEVCTGTTGHAEAVQVTFDPQVISYEELLELFFTMHDPTTLNRQGPDVGTQYRSAIYYHDEQQKRSAEEVMRRISQDQIWDAPLVTELAPLGEYYPAEEYHQQYFERNPSQPYCAAIIAPKVAKLRQKYMARLKQ